MIKVTRILVLLTIMMSTHMAVTIGKADKRSSVKWVSPEELTLLAAENKKPIIVDVYTSWCYYCKVMDNTTWKNDSVAAYLESNYYAVKINAENKEPYQWQGKTYEYEPRYKINMLAAKLLGGNIVYPSTVIIPIKGEPEVLSGAFTAKELEMILKYYGTRTNETTSPERYQQSFSGKWK